MPDGARAIVVTGASSGIGRALAYLAARAGFRVLIVARRGDRLEELSRAIGDAGGTSVALTGDVTAPEMPAKIVNRATASFGRIDVIVNNAGGGTYGALLDETDSAIAAQWQLNVAAPLRIARAGLPALTATRGQLVFVGSGSARIPLPYYGAYAPAKAAIRAAAIQLRRELSGVGIGVTYVDPGLVASEFHSAIGIERPKGIAATSTDRIARKILRGIERRRAVVNGRPWQIAGTVLGEWAGTLADSIVVSRFRPQRTDRKSEPVSVPHSDPSIDSAADTFEEALEPVSRRMERVKLPKSFLRDALSSNTTVELNDLAMRWAGMPNKNERAALREALETLQAAGYIAPLKDETWTVVRAPD